MSKPVDLNMVRTALDAAESQLEELRAHLLGSGHASDVEVRAVAARFCRMDDDSQARVFVEVARIMNTWRGGTHMQVYSIGRHLATCECSTPEARDLVRDLAAAIDHQPRQS